MIRVLAAVIKNADRYLVCQRPLHKRHGGLWEFPGGKLEPGESDLAAAQRELYEELGVKVSWLGNELFAVRDAGSEYLIAFVEVVVEGSPHCREHIELRWCDKTEIGQLPLAPSDRQFASQFILQPDRSEY
jgi:8-oxo-dGTP diphosphatase